MKMSYSNPEGRCLHCFKPIHYQDDFCAFCGRENDGWRECSEKQCGNCHEYIQEGDKYCRICGTKVGYGHYEPYQISDACIYGPRPVVRMHKCKHCDYEWSTCLMVDKQRYCPMCGYDEQTGKPGRGVITRC